MILDKITNRILGFLIRRFPNFIEYLVTKLLFTFKYVPQIFKDTKNYEIWESLGFHVTQAHFYQPLPELLKLDPSIWQIENPMNGIEVSRDGQISLMKQLVINFKNEFNEFQYESPSPTIPWVYYTNNNNFTSIDGEMYYGIIRNFKPNLIIEVGSGFSSFIANKALQTNQSGKLICIEPYPRDFLLNSPPKDVQLIQKRLEEIDLQFFQHLSENDILFIDSTHVVKLGSDVEYLFFHVLPCLNKGVIIHFHDIFYPFNYPEKWAKNQRYFWNEQYFLQTFLMYNNSYKILLCNSMVNHWETPYLKSNLKSYRQEKENPGSIWLIKVQ